MKEIDVIFENEMHQAFRTAAVNWEYCDEGGCVASFVSEDELDQATWQAANDSVEEYNKIRDSYTIVYE